MRLESKRNVGHNLRMTHSSKYLIKKNLKSIQSNTTSTQLPSTKHEDTSHFFTENGIFQFQADINLEEITVKLFCQLLKTSQCFAFIVPSCSRQKQSFSTETVSLSLQVLRRHKILWQIHAYQHFIHIDNSIPEFMITPKM